MSDAPERIILQGYGEYIRADLHAAQIADLQRQLAEARDQLSRLPTETATTTYGQYMPTLKGTP